MIIVPLINGLAELYLQTGQPEKAIPTLEKLVEYYPEQQEYASILQLIKQQQEGQPEQKPETSPEAAETE